MAFITVKNTLSDELKALDHQVDLGKGKPFPKSHFLYLIIGGVGSGKTSLAPEPPENKEGRRGLPEGI